MRTIPALLLAILATAAVLHDLRGDLPVAPNPLAKIVPRRNPQAIGNLEVYYYDYIADHIKDAPKRTLEGTQAYEALNLVNGARTVAEIRDIPSVAYGEVTGESVLQYLQLPARASVVTLQ